MSERTSGPRENVIMIGDVQIAPPNEHLGTLVLSPNERGDQLVYSAVRLTPGMEVVGVVPGAENDLWKICAPGAQPLTEGDRVRRLVTRSTSDEQSVQMAFMQHLRYLTDHRILGSLVVKLEPMLNEFLD